MKQPQRKTSKAAPDRTTSSTSLRYRKLKCPECRKFFGGPQGLAAHIRTRHPDAGKRPPQLTGPAAPPPIAGVPNVPAAAPAPEPGAVSTFQSELSKSATMSGRAHLLATQDELNARKAYIKGEVGRIRALEAEGATVDKQLAAIDLALKDFPS